MMDEKMNDGLRERIVPVLENGKKSKYNTTQLILVSFACGLMIGIFVGYAFL